MPSPRTQQQRRDESERRLLVAAAEIIAREGYAAATFERIGAAAGYSRGLASRKFGSKEALVAAIIRHVSARVHDRFDTVVAAIPSPRRQLLAGVDDFLRQVETDLAVRAYFMMMAATIAARAGNAVAFNAAHARFGDRLHTLIAAGQDRGEISRAFSAEGAANIVASILAGVAMAYALEPDTPTSTIREAALGFIARALPPDGEASER